MSRWHRPHVWLVRKKLAGMMPRTFVSAEDGKNGLVGPRPSSFMLTGETVGLTMRYARPSLASRVAHAAVAPTAAASTTANETRAAQVVRPAASRDTFCQR